jgi:hypothetical protein
MCSRNLVGWKSYSCEFWLSTKWPFPGCTLLLGDRGHSSYWKLCAQIGLKDGRSKQMTLLHVLGSLGTPGSSWSLAQSQSMRQWLGSREYHSSRYHWQNRLSVQRIRPRLKRFRKNKNLFSVSYSANPATNRRVRFRRKLVSPRFTLNQE